MRKSVGSRSYVGGNVLDLLLILLLLASAAGLVVRQVYSIDKGVSAEASAYLLSAQSGAIDPMVLDCMEPGDRL